MLIVHLVPESRALLTVETKDGAGRITGQVCDHNKRPLGRDEMHLARETYLDTFSGERFMRISHAEKEEFDADGVEDVYQGTGTISGWFVACPDYTINGHYGDGPAKAAKAEQTSEVAA